MIGIYKITSPSGKIYIGQSLNITKRINGYKKLSNCKNQIRLFNSFNKYGVENHIFEIVEECSIEELNCRERYWQDYYDVLSNNGLNIKLTKCGDLKAELTQESRDKMSNSLKITCNKSEFKEKMSKSTKKHWNSLTDEEKVDRNKHKVGKVFNEETKEKLSKAKKGKTKSQEDKDKIAKGVKEYWAAKKANKNKN